MKNEVSTPLVANTRDINHKEGERLLDAGFVGAYHAVRLGEGRDTPFKISKRIQTITVLKDLGIKWMNCVEPVGPEHDIEEILDLMFLARKHGATYSGVMRRINFPGSHMEPYGMISELEMARMVAVSRLVMGDVPKAHCTHEPHTASLIAGANLFFPEVGASPRDGEADTGKGRGKDWEIARKCKLRWTGIPICHPTAFNYKKMSRNPDKNRWGGISPLLPWVIPGLFLLLWFFVSHTGLIPTFLLPHPRDIAEMGYTYIFDKPGGGPYAGRFLTDAAASLLRVGCGFIMAVAVGLPLGILSGRLLFVQKIMARR